MNQSLSLYRVFYTVATRGNISKAAEELFISQPAISKSIKKLEEGLNTTLFLRNSRGVELTEEGKLLYQYVQSAFETLKVGEGKLQQITELGMGHLKIGVSTTLCKHILLPYLKKFVSLHPHIKISIECQSSNITLQMLEDHNIDIGLIGQPSNKQNVAFYPLGEIEDIFVATKQYIDNVKVRNPKHSKNILNYSALMILDKENLTRQYVEGYLRKNNLELSHVLEVSSMDLLIEFATIGLGAACVIKEFVQPHLTEGSLIHLPLDVPIPKRTIGFAHTKTSTLSHTTLEFVDFFQKEGGMVD
ncbi:MAG TPA: LysR family transcriptional regulator [Candidatus Merdenecus merdavium]|nr:LysR family transcriptional regulator [Candidatus Merdenecus merdavium]